MNGKRYLSNNEQYALGPYLLYKNTLLWIGFIRAPSVLSSSVLYAVMYTNGSSYIEGVILLQYVFFQ